MNESKWEKKSYREIYLLYVWSVVIGKRELQFHNSKKLNKSWPQSIIASWIAKNPRIFFLFPNRYLRCGSKTKKYQPEHFLAMKITAWSQFVWFLLCVSEISFEGAGSETLSRTPFPREVRRCRWASVNFGPNQPKLIL